MMEIWITVTYKLDQLLARASAYHSQVVYVALIAVKLFLMLFCF